MECRWCSDHEGWRSQLLLDAGNDGIHLFLRKANGAGKGGDESGFGAIEFAIGEGNSDHLLKVVDLVGESADGGELMGAVLNRVFGRYENAFLDFQSLADGFEDSVLARSPLAVCSGDGENVGIIFFKLNINCYILISFCLFSLFIILLSTFLCAMF